MNCTKKGTYRKVKEKAAWGTHSNSFMAFYKSGLQKVRKEYSETDEAIRAQISMSNLMRRKSIYDVRITRRRNVLYLEKMEAGKC